jgi:malate dehydrogenase (oxaloacetate-decarboxylating)
MAGAVAAGTAIIKLLLAAGATDIVAADIDGVVHKGRPGLSGGLPGWRSKRTSSTTPAH